jgi:hypothetical protein
LYFPRFLSRLIFAHVRSADPSGGQRQLAAVRRGGWKEIICVREEIFYFGFILVSF